MFFFFRYQKKKKNEKRKFGTPYLFSQSPPLSRDALEKDFGGKSAKNHRRYRLCKNSELYSLSSEFLLVQGEKLTNLLAHSGGFRGGRKGRAPRAPKFFRFHAVFGKMWQNCMLAPPPGELAPPGEILDPPLAQLW